MDIQRSHGVMWLPSLVGSNGERMQKVGGCASTSPGHLTNGPDCEQFFSWSFIIQVPGL